MRQLHTAPYDVDDTAAAAHTPAAVAVHNTPHHRHRHRHLRQSLHAVVAVVVVAAVAVALTAACRMLLAVHGIPVMVVRSHMDVVLARMLESAVGPAVVPVVAGRIAAAAAAVVVAVEQQHHRD